MPSESSSSRSFQPTFAWMLASPFRVLALGFGSGLLRPAPGTWGTLAGWLLWALVLRHFSDPLIALVLLAGFVLGCVACERAGRDAGVADHGAFVWDEIIAIWLVLWLVPDTFGFQLLAFLVFRFFDIVKPPPIRTLDRRLKNGVGVMIDDLLAAGYSVLLIAIIIRTGPFS